TQDGALTSRTGPFGPVIGARQAAADVQSDVLPALLLTRDVLVPPLCLLVPRLIDGQTLLARHLPRQVQRKAISLVEVESGFALDLFLACLRLLSNLRILDEAPFNGGKEIGLFTADDLVHPFRIRLQLGIGAAHMLYYDRHKLVDERLAQAKALIAKPERA